MSEIIILLVLWDGLLFAVKWICLGITAVVVLKLIEVLINAIIDGAGNAE